MATGTPATATTGSAGQASAAFWNAEVRDAFTDAYAAWSSYTPTWTASSNPAIGNGTISGRSKKIAGYGKTCMVWFRVTFGSTTTYGTGAWTISLPFQSSALSEQVGLLRYANGSGNYLSGHVVVAASTTGASLWVPTSSASPYLIALSGAAPTPTPASTGWFTGQFTYEVT